MIKQKKIVQNHRKSACEVIRDFDELRFAHFFTLLNVYFSPKYTKIRVRASPADTLGELISFPGHLVGLRRDKEVIGVKGKGRNVDERIPVAKSFAS